MIGILTVEIPYDKLLARLGYLQAKTKLNERTIGLIKENLSFAQKLIKPKIAVAFEDIKISGDFVLFENGYKIKSGNVAMLLKNCCKAYGVGATISEVLECKMSEFLKKKETFNALILDAAGSVAVEETMILANTQIKIYEEKKGSVLTKRYSPGYGDWTLEDNKHFLNWIGAERIGVKLNEFYQMKPEKSVSSLIGVQKNFKVNA
jgi:hypothetical protein